MAKIAYRLKKVVWYVGPDFMTSGGNLCEEAWVGEMHIGTIMQKKSRSSPKRFKAATVLPHVAIDFDQEWFMTAAEAREMVLSVYRVWLSRFTKKIKI